MFSEFLDRWRLLQARRPRSDVSLRRGGRHRGRRALLGARLASGRQPRSQKVSIVSVLDFSEKKTQSSSGSIQMRHLLARRVALRARLWPRTAVPGTDRPSQPPIDRHCPHSRAARVISGVRFVTDTCRDCLMAIRSPFVSCSRRTLFVVCCLLAPHRCALVRLLHPVPFQRPNVDDVLRHPLLLTCVPLPRSPSPPLTLGRCPCRQRGRTRVHSTAEITRLASYRRDGAAADQR